MGFRPTIQNLYYSHRVAIFWLRNDEYDDDDTDFKVYFYDFYIVTERGAAALMGMPNWQSDLSWIMVIGKMEISFALVWASFVSYWSQLALILLPTILRIMFNFM